MKTRSLLLVALLAIASSVSAQFANTNVSSSGNNMRSVDTEGWEKVILWSGVTITDIESIKRDNGQIYGNKVHYGDIMVYNGVRYIYTSLSDGEWKDFPTSTGPGNCGGNWYRVDP